MRNSAAFILLFAFAFTGCDNGGNTAAKSLESIPNLDTPGGKIFKEFCSACHGLPSPTVHKADEWANVIERMQVHRIKKAYLPLSDEQKQDLVNYLKENSAG